MYQVLFAEDELLVRLGLHNVISWKEFNMQLVAEADNGIRAFELFQQIRPDVVITDICMRGMDGCDLIRKIREIDQQCAIIVISCLDDFEILRKMIPYKIAGYILKASMSLEEIHKILTEVREYLDNEHRNQMETGAEEETIEEQLARYLQDEGYHPLWKKEPDLSTLILFTLPEAELQKINELAMKFMYELLKKEFPESFVVNTTNKFCVLLSANTEYPEKKIEKINRLTDGFLGVRFLIHSGKREPGEDIRKLYRKVCEVSKEGTSGENKLIKEAIMYMRENHKSEVSLPKMAKILGISPGYLSTLFKKEMGKTYIEYLNEIRLGEVLEELKNSDHKIAAIAESHGFNNVEYFYRMFKKHTGESPGKWREKNQ